MGKFSVRCSPGIAGLVLAAADVPSGPLHRGGVGALLRGPGVRDCGSRAGLVSASPLVKHPGVGGGGWPGALQGGGGHVLWGCGGLSRLVVCLWSGEDARVLVRGDRGGPGGGGRSLYSFVSDRESSLYSVHSLDNIFSDLK